MHIKYAQKRRDLPFSIWCVAFAWAGSVPVHETRGNVQRSTGTRIALEWTEPKRWAKNGRRQVQGKSAERERRKWMEKYRERSEAQVSLEKELDAVRPAVEGTSTFCGPRGAPVRCTVPTTFCISLIWIIPFRFSSDFSRTSVCPCVRAQFQGIPIRVFCNFLVSIKMTAYRHRQL